MPAVHAVPFQYISPAVTPMLGWLPEDFIGKLATEFWHPDDRAEANALRMSANQGGTGTRVLRMRHRDGTYRWIEVVARPAPQPDGRKGAVGVLLRLGEDGNVCRELVSGRVLHHERVRDALLRHLEKDLGPMALPRVPASPRDVMARTSASASGRAASANAGPPGKE